MASEKQVRKVSGKSTKVIAELVIAPFGVGTSLSKYVKESVKELDGTGVCGSSPSLNSMDSQGFASSIHR